MPLKVTISIKGDDIVKRRLKALGDGINDLSEAMRQIGQSAIKYYSDTGFAYKGQPWGSTWPDLSVQYKKWKEKHSVSGSAYPLLVFSGKMQDSFFATANRSSVTIDNKMPYYKYHQSSAARTKIPYRPMAGINADIKEMVKSTIHDEIVRKMRLA